MLANLFFRHVSSFRTATCFGMFDFGMFKCGPLHTKMRSFRHVSFFFPRASACLILASLMLVICMQRCGPSGMFLRSACFGMFDFGMFDFGMFNYFLLSACCIPHTHTLPARCWSCSWSRGRAELRRSNAVRRRHDRCCFLHANFHHVVLFWSLWPNKKLQTTAVAFHTHTHTLPARCCSCLWSRGRDELRCSNAVQRRHDRCCFLCMQTFIMSFCFGRFGPTRLCRQQL